MQPDSPITRYWQRFIHQQPAYANRPYDFWGFGDTPQMADELGALVRSGVKGATTGLYWEYAYDNEPVTQTESISMVLDGAGNPLCIIEITQVDVLPFNEVDNAFAYDEGEGDRSLAYWQDAHWRFFSRRCEVIGREPVETMLVVCERFRLLFSE